MPPAVLVYSPRYVTYRLSPSHPFTPERLIRTFDLIEAYGLLARPECAWREPEPATEEQLLRVHDAEYMEVVRACGVGEHRPDALAYGLGTSDNPTFPNMFEATALCVGGSVLAADLVATGEANVAFNVGGGLHHAHRRRAAGFCIFNDAAVAIAQLLAVHGAKRVAYLDIDAHHGDGVQEAFYDRPEVLTISLHESGRFLFPGTGDVDEMGEGDGVGYSVNVPLAPWTDDDTYRWTFEEVVPPLIQAYQPDYLVAGLGADGHAADPLTHLGLTVTGWNQIVAEISRLAPRWIALGGGGYDLDTVPRAWTLAYAVMAGLTLPEEIPASQRARYESPALHYDANEVSPDARAAARTFAEAVVAEVKRVIFPHHGLR
jgi:acetoin utilization protein AcuC